MNKTVILVWTSMILPAVFAWTNLAFIQRSFLVFSNLAMIPALKRAAKKRVWFEFSFVLLMGTVSIIYHALFDLVDYWGVKFRRGDWVLALTAPFVLINYVLRHKNSNFKMIANFWAVYIAAFFVTYLQDNTILYIGILIVYIIIIYTVRDRHFCSVSIWDLSFAVTWGTIGVVLFYVSDYVMYWLLHTYWHYAAFLGIYYVLGIGSPEDDVVCEIQKTTLPVIASQAYLPSRIPESGNVINGMRF